MENILKEIAYKAAVCWVLNIILLKYSNWFQLKSSVGRANWQLNNISQSFTISNFFIYKPLERFVGMVGTTKSGYMICYKMFKLQKDVKKWKSEKVKKWKSEKVRKQ